MTPLLSDVSLTVTLRACIASFLTLYDQVGLHEQMVDSLWASMPVTITVFVGMRVFLNDIRLTDLQIY